MIVELAHELLPYAAALYAFDGLIQVRRGARLLYSTWGRRFRWREPGWRLASPLPTLQVFLADGFEVRVSERAAHVAADGADALLADPSQLTALPFETLGACRAEGRNVFANGRRVFVAPSPSAARRSAEMLRLLAAGRPPQDVLRDRISAEMDVVAVRARRAQQLRAAPLLAASSALLFAVLFVGLPATVYRAGATSAGVGLVAATAAILWSAVVVLAARALRRAGSTRREALATLAPAFLFPPAAAHVLSFLWRDSLRAWSPLAVASVLLGPAEFRRVARHELRRLDEAARRTAGTELEADTRVRRDAVTRLLAGLGIDPGGLAAGEAPQDALAAVFCPLCEAEYRAGFVQCTDCGVGLRPFAPTPGLSGSPAPR